MSHKSNLHVSHLPACGLPYPQTSPPPQHLLTYSFTDPVANPSHSCCFSISTKHPFKRTSLLKKGNLCRYILHVPRGSALSTTAQTVRSQWRLRPGRRKIRFVPAPLTRQTVFTPPPPFCPSLAFPDFGLTCVLPTPTPNARFENLTSLLPTFS